MDYYTPLEHRTMSFKEFMQEWVLKQFKDSSPSSASIGPGTGTSSSPSSTGGTTDSSSGVWYWRPTVWWNPDGAVSAAEREWLEEKYPGWNDRFGTHWDVGVGERPGRPHGEGVPRHPADPLQHAPAADRQPLARSRRRRRPGPRKAARDGRKYQFCSDPCLRIFEDQPERFAGHLNVVDRLLSGMIDPPTPAGVIQYMGITDDVSGDYAADYAWAREPAT